MNKLYFIFIFILSWASGFAQNNAKVTVTTSGNAAIWVNDSYKGLSRWEGLLPLGNHKIEARLDKHHTIEKFVTISGETYSLDFEPLEPIYKLLHISTENGDETDVYINGNYLGKASDIYEILLGYHLLELEREGFDIYCQIIEIKDVPINTISVELKEKVKNPEILHLSPDANHENENIFLKEKEPLHSLWLYVLSPQAVLGGQIGFCRKFGAYVKFQMNVEDEYEFSEFDIDNPYLDEKRSDGYRRKSVTAGALAHIKNGFYWYGGIGYGKYGKIYSFKDTSEKYAITEYAILNNVKGLEVETGIVYGHFPFSLSLGYTTILGKVSHRGSTFRAIHFGIGFYVPHF